MDRPACSRGASRPPGLTAVGRGRADRTTGSAGCGRGRRPVGRCRAPARCVCRTSASDTCRRIVCRPSCSSASRPARRRVHAARRFRAVETDRSRPRVPRRGYGSVVGVTVPGRRSPSPPGDEEESREPREERDRGCRWQRSFVMRRAVTKCANALEFASSRVCTNRETLLVESRSLAVRAVPGRSWASLNIGVGRGSSLGVVLAHFPLGYPRARRARRLDSI